MSDDTKSDDKFFSTREVGLIKAWHPFTGDAITVNPQKDARIGGDLDKELRRLPGLLSWYSALKDTAKDKVKLARFNEHTTREALAIKIRATSRLSNEKLSETELKERVAYDEIIAQHTENVSMQSLPTAA